MTRLSYHTTIVTLMLLAKLKPHLKTDWIVYVIAIIALWMRLPFRSRFLEDWDSAQFAMALDNFSIADHLPHPPGYPLYVLLGKLFFFFFDDHTQALTTFSAICGAAIVLPLYFLTKRMFGLFEAVLASLLYIIIPVSWMLSEVALTNIPGLFFLSVFVWLVYLFHRQKTKLLWVAFLGGVILGVRFTELPVIVGLLLLIAWKNQSLKLALKMVVAVVIGALVWLAPLMLISGFGPFWESFGWIAGYVFSHDSLQGQKNIGLDWLSARAHQLVYLLEVSYSWYLLLPFGGFLAWLSFHGWVLGQFRYQFLVVWFVSYFLPLSLVYNLEVPRYTLPLALPFAIFVAVLMRQLAGRYRLVALASIGLLTVGIFSHSWSQIWRFGNVLPPTIAPVLYVKDHFDPSQTIVGATFTYRQFQYYADAFEVFYGQKLKEATVDDKIVIVDYLGLRKEIEQLGDFIVTDSKEFVGDRDIFTRIPRVTLYVLKKAAGDGQKKKL